MFLGKGILVGGPWLDPSLGPSTAAAPAPAVKPIPFGGNLIFRQESIKALLRTLSARDPYTGHHSNRVTNIALAFARSLHLSPQDLENLANVGYLHDIGKIGVSDSILLKPGPLTPEERAVIETHPLIGEKIVEPLKFKVPGKRPYFAPPRTLGRPRVPPWPGRVGHPLSLPPPGPGRRFRRPHLRPALSPGL